MKLYLAASTCALFLLAGGAFAQTTSSDTTSSTSTTAPTVAVPAPGTLSTTETHSSNDGAGNTVDSKKTTYGNAYGSGSDSTTTTTTAPQPAPAATTSSQSTTSTTN